MLLSARQRPHPTTTKVSRRRSRDPLRSKQLVTSTRARLPRTALNRNAVVTAAAVFSGASATRASEAHLIGAQLHNKFFAIIAIEHIPSCKLESAFL